MITEPVLETLLCCIRDEHCQGDVDNLKRIVLDLIKENESLQKELGHTQIDANRDRQSVNNLAHQRQMIIACLKWYANEKNYEEYPGVQQSPTHNYWIPALVIKDKGERARNFLKSIRNWPQDDDQEFQRQEVERLRKELREKQT